MVKLMTVTGRVSDATNASRRASACQGWTEWTGPILNEPSQSITPSLLVRLGEQVQG